MNQNKANYSPAHILARDHPLSVVFPYTVFYVLWFHYLEATVTGNYLVMYTRLDELIPFLSVSIAPYLPWFIYIFATLLYFSRMDEDEAANLYLFLSLGMTVALFICIVFPNGTNLRVPAGPTSGFFASLVRMIQSTSISTNVFPSIHVFNALAVHVAVTRSRSLTHRPLVRHASLILILLICLSTVFLKKHSVLDVFDALLLGYSVNAVVYDNYKVPVLIPTGTGALFRREKSPTKAYRQLRKK